MEPLPFRGVGGERACPSSNAPNLPALCAETKETVPVFFVKWKFDETEADAVSEASQTAVSEIIGVVVVAVYGV